MEKIVVLGKPKKGISTLLALLEAVFPECEICSITPDTSNGGVLPGDSTTVRSYSDEDTEAP